MEHKIISLLLIFITGTICFGHGNKTHESAKSAGRDVTRLIERINLDYKEWVKPIFKKKCFDCHSGFTSYPWYYKVPGVRSLIDSDIQEGRKHIDFSNDFPFKGHGSPKEDLQALEKVINEHTMPPWRYRKMHLGSRIIPEEEKSILKWVTESLGLLR